MNKKKELEFYVRPELVKHESLREITFECPQWQCSISVPPPPGS